MSLPRRVEALVFDMDGLLIDSEVLVRAAVMKAAAALGHEYPHELYGRTMGRADQDYIEIVRDHFGPGFPMERFLAEGTAEITRAFEAGVCLKQGVVELLDDLDRRGLPYALATSSPRASAERHLSDHGLWDRFAAVVARDDVDRHKPDPAPFLKAAALLGTAPAACLALEDSHNGVRAAHAAGMMTVMVPDLLGPTEEMRGLCIHILESLHEVRDLLAA